MPPAFPPPDTSMIDIVLGVIAFASLTTLAVEIWFAVVLVRTARRVKARVERIGESARSLRAHAEAIASDVGKSQRLALRQIGRVQDAYAVTMSALGPVLTAIGVARSVAAVFASRSGRRR